MVTLPKTNKHESNFSSHRQSINTPAEDYQSNRTPNIEELYKEAQAQIARYKLAAQGMNKAVKRLKNHNRTLATRNNHVQNQIKDLNNNNTELMLQIIDLKHALGQRPKPKA